METTSFIRKTHIALRINDSRDDLLYQMGDQQVQNNSEGVSAVLILLIAKACSSATATSLERERLTTRIIDGFSNDCFA